MAYFEKCCLTTYTCGFILILITWITWKIGKRIIAMNMLRPVIERKKRIREEGFKALERKYGTIDLRAQKILALPENQLIEQLQKRQLTAVEVLEAFVAKALEIQQKHNCIIEFVPKAHKWAKELDELKDVKGPLHGIPVSIKDNCDIEGHDSTLGLAKKCFNPKTDHSVLVKTLLDLGAIPFCKTNVPQTLLSFGCSNPIFGTTTSFLNPYLTPGGSSGGEATLIAGGGSILGIASDIGGSVRIPGHFSGVFALKTTNLRLSPVGFTPSIPNVVGIAAVPGIMSKSIDTLILGAKSLLEDCPQYKHDKMLIPVPWNNKPFEEKRKLRIGYFTSLPYFPLVGDTEAVVLDAKAALEKDGHTLIPFEMPDGYRIMKVMAGMTLADLGYNMCKNWEGEVIPGLLMPNFLAMSLPLWLKKVVGYLMELPIPFIHSKRGSIFLRGGAGISKDLMECIGERKALAQEVIKQWEKLNLDVILSPAFPFPAVPVSMTSRMQSAIIYTVTWNVLDFPCGVVKWGVETGKNILPYDDDKDFMLRPAPKAVKEAIGMPISVQIVSLPFQDEMVLYGMKCLQDLTPSSKSK